MRWPVRKGSFGINLIEPDRGTQYGVGQAAVQYQRAIEAAGIRCRRVPVKIFEADGERRFEVSAKNPFSVNLFTINGFDSWAFRRDVDLSFFEGRLNISNWIAEVSPLPHWMLPCLDLADEIWVEAEHVRQILEPVSPVPVITMQPSVSAPAPATRSRAQLGLAEGFLFLNVFDLNSSLERKNPHDLITAYKATFGPDDGANLQFKVGNADSQPRAFEKLLAAARGRADIRVSTEHLSRADLDAWIASCDAYVSLHRAEGFGFTMPEAMLAGKPVVATRYSANLDYMDDDNSLLVDAELVRVGGDGTQYPAEGFWAQPDVTHAAALMRQLFDDPVAAKQLGDRACASSTERFSAQRAGAAIEQRLRLSLQMRAKRSRLTSSAA